MSYILIILAVLVLLNTYPLLVSQSLVFRTKETAMKSSVKMVESALSGLPELTEENVGQALASVEETGVSRLLVTDTSGCILFDTREGGSAKGMYAMYTEIVQALDGSDAFYCRYDSHAFLSRGASPVVYRNRIIGAVYAYEYDTQQAELLQSFQTNLTRISLLIGVLVVALSALLSRAFTRKIRELLQAIRQVREGAYSHRASVRGNDEIAQLATEFNSLTDRLPDHRGRPPPLCVRRQPRAENAPGRYPPADRLHPSDGGHERRHHPGICGGYRPGRPSGSAASQRTCCA